MERGFAGVEVDLFLIGEVLRVGHSRREAQNGRSLEEQYLTPLEALFRRCEDLGLDGVPLLLNLELKENSRRAYEELRASLARHPRLLRAAEQEALQLVLVGWYPEDEPLWPLLRQHRLSRDFPLPSGEDAGEVALVSLDYGKTFGRWWSGPGGRREWQRALAAAARGKGQARLRVHNVPADAAVYRRLLSYGVDLIGVEELEAGHAALVRSD